MNFKNMKISKKLFIGFGIIVVLTTILAVFSIYSAISIDSTYTHLIDFAEERLMALYRTDAKFTEARRALMQAGTYAGIDGGEETISNQTKMVDARIPEVHAELDLFLNLVENDSKLSADQKSEKAERVSNIKKLIDQWYNEIAVQASRSSIEGNRKDFLDTVTRGLPISTGLLNDVTELIGIVKTENVNESAEVTHSTNFSMIILAVIAAGIILMCIVLGVVITKSTVTALKNAVGSMNEISDHIIAAARELSEGSQHIATGAGEQASSIEETSATMNESASMISQNAENTRVAAQIAADAMNMANKGMQEMQNMTQAMNEIKDSSDKVSKIVKTIDDIAFQTNLLAINATVEAARASGDAGRSFGVVAEEVRNLAQKSAESASNTTSIIEKNITLTNSGQDISNGVSVSLEEITEKASQLNKLIAEINAASEEQSQGIKQINIAVSQIEKVTQQTAAVAEQTAASSQNLQNDAYHLTQVVDDVAKLI